jgi:hypothetical protein
MTSVGRNEPCPCGSGRKFKRCCAARPLVRPHTVTPDDVGHAGAALARLTGGARFREDEARAREMCFGPGGFPGYDPETNADLAALHITLFQEWFWFDYVFHTGMTAAVTLLTGDVASLDVGARQAVAICARAPLRVLRVEAVDAGERLWVSDAIDATVPQQVADAAASRMFVPGEALLARLGDVGDRRQIVGVSCRLGRDEPADLARVVTRMRRRVAAEALDVTPTISRMLDALAILRFVMDADESQVAADSATSIIVP